MRLWVPSQKGLFTDPPQRQSENAVLPVRSNLLPLASTRSIEPSGASTRYGPFGFTVILTSAMNSNPPTLRVSNKPKKISRESETCRFLWRLPSASPEFCQAAAESSEDRLR